MAKYYIPQRDEIASELYDIGAEYQDDMTFVGVYLCVGERGWFLHSEEQYDELTETDLENLYTAQETLQLDTLEIDDEVARCANRLFCQLPGAMSNDVQG